ncbi:MAG: hypothetical protein HYX66_04240 [Ignavibacteria bacterium]|nr:hypothetical protein [Ignavibacteria bacterium]
MKSIRLSLTIFTCVSVVGIPSSCLQSQTADSVKTGPANDSTQGHVSPVGSTEPADTAKMNVDAIYSRPFLMGVDSDVGIGGYLEANMQSLNDNGVNEGISFQARRLTLFLSATPANRLKFLTEIEFENGTEEINIEFASLDLAFSRAFTIRGGIVLIPIGAFNQNHDGPRWNFIDRPISATQILPSTWSAPGIGVLGKIFLKGIAISYETYLTNGLNESIISNELRRTSLPSAKSDPGRFGNSFNGRMMISARTAVSTPVLGELGLSYAGGVYSQTSVDGLNTGPALWMHAVAADYSIGSFDKTFYSRAELNLASVDLPTSIEPVYGKLQVGGYADFNYNVWRGAAFGFAKSSVFVALRLEYADFHVDPSSTDESASGDETWSGTLGLAFHPSAGTIVRANYRTTWITDVLGNIPIRQAAVQFGITTYF